MRKKFIVIKTQTNLFLLSLIIIGFLFRFYNIYWGSPFFFHPDERNIASAVSQMQIPHSLNPHFFAYGGLPLYAIFFVGLLINFLTSCQLALTDCSVSFEQAILISRIFSAIFSLLLIPLLFTVGKRFYNKTIGLWAACLGCFSVGLIQFAHFGTVEMWLTFFGTLLFFSSIQYYKTQQLSYILQSSIYLGILIATKVSSLILLPFFIVILLSQILRKTNKHFWKKHLLIVTSYTILLISIITFIFLVTNPYVFLEKNSFLESIRYETNVARGILPVFYTGEFYNSIPIIFQLIHIYPFLLNPLLTIISVLSIIYFIFRCFKKRDSTDILLFSFFSILFLSQAFLFVKWTRYMIPTLPFLYLITAIFLSEIFFHFSKYKKITKMFSITIIFTSIVFTIFYSKTVLYNIDTRINASLWASKYINKESHILSETYDLGVIPFNTSFKSITLFNFYDLDNNSYEYNEETLEQELLKTDYIILPSTRILKNRLNNPQTFPIGYRFYHQLITNQLGFKKIYETPCDLFCKIIYLGNPIYSFEQTTHVFDRPTVIIFKKI